MCDCFFLSDELLTFLLRTGLSTAYIINDIRDAVGCHGDQCSCFYSREENWKRKNYTSCNIDYSSGEDEEQDDDDGPRFNDEDRTEEDAEREEEVGGISYVVGDVTHPQNTKENDAIIVHVLGEIFLLIYVHVLGAIFLLTFVHVFGFLLWLLNLKIFSFDIISFTVMPLIPKFDIFLYHGYAV